jgi:acyl-CoA synthetase (AMP-forming)/AMP-acid ligase II
VPNPRSRAVVFAAALAALLGFAAGWVARTLTWPTAEDRAEATARELRDRIRSLAR